MKEERKYKGSEVDKIKENIFSINLDGGVGKVTNDSIKNVRLKGKLVEEETEVMEDELDDVSAECIKVNLISRGSNDSEAGPSECVKKDVTKCEKVINTQVTDHEEVCRYHVETPSEVGEGEGAMVLYVQKVLHEAMENLEKLNLKREAGEELESSMKKRRKIDGKENVQPYFVTTFVGDLRKVKAKIRKSVKRKSKNMETDEKEVVHVGGRQKELKAWVAGLKQSPWNHESLILELSKFGGCFDC